MKKIIFLLLLSVFTLSCKKDSQEIFMHINHHTVNCVGLSAQNCMLVKIDGVDTDWTYFYDKIEGFNYEEGYVYLLKVKSKTIKDPPMDGSSIKYILTEIVSKQKAK